MTTRTPTHSQIAARVVASLFGSYVFVWGFVALGIAGLVGLGQTYGEAEALVFLLAFLVYALCFCWTFVAESSTRVWAVLVGGGAAMTGLAWLLARALT